MTLHLDALARRCSARLATCSETELRMFDLLLDYVQRARDARLDDGGPLFATGADYSESDNAYRRGHNDAMRAETPQTMLWRMRLLVTTRAEEIEAGLAELRQNAPRELSGVVEFDLSDQGSDS